MQNSKNIKIIVGLFYLVILFIFLYLLFSKFDLEEITTYKFIKLNREYLIGIKDSNIVLSSLVFMIFTIIWVFLLGFGSPILLVAGFIFGKWIGTLIAASSLCIGATFLYIFGNFFLKEIIKEKFLNKYKNLETKFKNNELIFIFIYRIVGGIPFQIANLLPVIFNVRVKNYFFGTLLGLIPSAFIISSLGSGIEKVIEKNDELPSMMQLLLSPEIYLPILGFILLVFLTLKLKKNFYKN